MAKIKISELAKELGLESRDVVSYLQEQGVEAAKRSTSSVEDAEAVKARKHFGKAVSNKVEEKKEQEVKEAKEVKEPVKEEKRATNEEKNMEKNSDMESAPAKKKKKIIIISNQGNSRTSQGAATGNNHSNSGNAGNNNGNRNDRGGDNRRQGGNGGSQRGRNNSFSATQNAYHPIKPRTAPSQLEYESNIRKTEEYKPEPVEKAKAETAPVKPAETAASKPAAPQTENKAPRTEESTPVQNTQPRENAAPRRDDSARPARNNTEGSGRSYNNNRDYNNRGSQNGDQRTGGYRGGQNNGQNGGYRGGQNGQNGDQRTGGYRGGQNGQNGGYRGGQNGQSGDQRTGGYRGGQNGQTGGYRGGQNGQTGGYRGGQNGQTGGYRGGQNGQTGGYRGGQNGQGGDQRTGGYRGGQNGQGRPGQGGFRNDRNGGGMGGRPSFDGRNGGGRPSQGHTSAEPAPLEKTSKHNDRRFDKDKKSKKDYEVDEERMPRSKRVGRFIKPEVKIEEKTENQTKVISIPENLTIKELADKMKLQPSVIIKKLFLAGQIVTVNSVLSYEEAENIAIEYEIFCEKEIPVDVIEELLKEDDDEDATLVSRPPVVCVMGHVDHGKTSLLDKIRDSSVTEKEAGGITQKIGAYTVSIKDRKITFLDTPGHEAFTAMRMRGANSTDIAVLVVAADDGVMPQTIEAINHAKAANIEIIVAVNKIDKPSANIDRVKQEMTEYGLISTDWGGTTEFVPVSAKTGEGIDTLLETIILTADILELKANPNRTARGLVLEAKLDKGRGPVANILVQKGTLHVGDFISAGACYGHVRAMADDKGRRVKKATPSQPIEILGLSDVPNAGEVIIAHDSDKEAKQFADIYLQQHKKDLIEETKAKMSLDDLYSKIEEGKLKELDIIIKADVQGSVEALKASLMKLSNEEVVVKIIHGGVGAITESDVSLASASNAIIIGFDVRPDATAKSMAEHEGVEMKLYKVIYQAIDDVEAALKGMLAPIYEEKITGHAEVRQIFKASSIGNIAGSFILDGNIQKGCKVRVNRGSEMIFEGDLASIKRFKDDVKEVKEGFECGLVFDGFDQINVGDTVEAYVMVEVPRQ